MEINEERKEYQIIMANLSCDSIFSYFTAIYKKEDNSVGYLNNPLKDVADIIKFTSENTAKLVFIKKKHVLLESTWELSEIVIPDNIMFNK